MTHFSHTVLQRVIRDKIVDKYDLIVEGGIGTNLNRYIYFRGNGYTGLYIAINLLSDSLSKVKDSLSRMKDSPSEMELASGVNLVTGDCFMPPFRNTNASRSLFFSYGALGDCLLTGQYEDVTKAVDVLSEYYSAQFHMRPIVSGIEIYHPRMHRTGDTSNESYRRFQQFVELSAEKGWKTEIIAKNLIFMERQRTS